MNSFTNTYSTNTYNPLDRNTANTSDSLDKNTVDASARLLSSKIDSSANDSVNALLLQVRQMRGNADLVVGFTVVKKLTVALRGCLSSGKERIVERLLLKELGIWCYLLYQQGAYIDYLNQAATCLRSVRDRHGSDAEVEMYYAFVLWSKIQQGIASQKEQQVCIMCLEACTEKSLYEVPQLGAVWLRLGGLYSKGIGCIQDPLKAKRCFIQARKFGLDC